MPPQYEKERPENETFPDTTGPLNHPVAHEDQRYLKQVAPATIGEQSPAVQTPNNEATVISLNPEQQQQTEETARTIRALETQRNQIEARARTRYDGINDKFQFCLAKLNEARANEDYPKESQLAHRAGELKADLGMAKKVVGRATEDIQNIDNTLTTLRRNQEQPEQMERLAA